LIKQVYIRYLLSTALALFYIAGTLKAQTNKGVGVEVRENKNQKNNLKTTSSANCPSGSAVDFFAIDTTTGNFLSGSNTLTLSCGAAPFLIKADNTNDIVTPCVLSQYNISGLDFNFYNEATETFYEGNKDLFCIGPSSSCLFPVGGTGGPVTGSWNIDKIYLDPSQQHNFQFCYTGALPLMSNVQLQDCWTGDSLAPVRSFGLILSNNCFMDSILANTDIGIASYSIAPASASVAFTDFHNGKSIVNPALLPAGTYTVTYSFKPSVSSGCNMVNGTFKFTILPVAISVNSPTICAGATATLTASGAATSYSWSPGLSATTGSTVTASPGSGVTIYTVTGTKGTCTTTATSTVTVNATPTVTVNSPSVCAGSTATLTASGATTYSWTPATGLSATTGSMVTTTTSSLTTYTVTGKSGGCSSSATATINVNPTLTITVNSATICVGGTATLTASGATTYTWNTSATNASINPSPTTTTPYTVTATSGGCVASATTSVKVNQLPTITVNSPSICAGGTATLTANGATTYTWNTSAISNSITPSPGTTTPYTVTGTDANNCKNIVTLTVTVNSAPTISVNTATICAGGTATLTASGATTYTWNTLATNASISPSPTTTTPYTVSATTNGCSSTKTTTVTVNNLPSISVNSATICIGNTATLTASGANTYTWNTSATSASIASSPATTVPYTVTGTDANNCKNTATSTVTVNPLPTISVNTATICAGVTTTLTATGATTYTWNTSTTSTSITPSPSATTPYTVTGTDIHACKNIATSTVVVNSLPIISVNSATICAGGTATLSATGATTYTWNTSATSNSITTSPNTTTPYTVTGTNANSCKNIATSTVVVNSLPIISVNSATICVGNLATLTASGAITYTWNTSATGASITTSPSSTTPYTVTGTDIHACKNSAASIVTVYSLPTISVNTTTICAGATTTLTANGAITYTWNTSAISNSITPSPAATTAYTVTGTDIHACKNIATTTVHVNPTPIATANVSTPVCVGQAIHFSTNATGSATYSWSGPNGFTSSSQNPTITNATLANAGNYILTATSLGCATTDTIKVNVDAIPTVANAGTDTILYASSLSLNGNVALVGTGIWSVISGSGNILNSSNANTQITNLQSGPTILQWTISNGACPASYDEVTIFVKDLLIPNGFSPNGDGMNDNFEVRGLEEYSNVKINVFNRWGNLVYDNGDYKNNWNGKNMSGEDLSDDTYFFTLEVSSKNKINGYVTLKRK
jgi:gliding motility-associated-like protein